jgi:Flp pilus assembly protein TadG
MLQVYAIFDDDLGVSVMKNFVKTFLMSTAANLRDFADDQSGSILQMTGLSIIPLMLAAGVAIDTSRVNFTHQKLAAGLDAGALAAATMNAASDADMQTEAKKYLDRNFLNSDTITITAFNLTSSDNSVTFTGTARVPMTIMKLGGTDYIDVKLSSTVIKDGKSSVEVALVLDNTASMGPYMTDLKAAANDFLDTIVVPADPPYYSKVALIPYNRGVNMGTSATAARGAISTGTSTTPGSTNFTFTSPTAGTVTMPITNCVSERIGAQAYTDAPVATSPVGRVYANSNNPCINAELKPLSSDKTALKAVISTMTAGSSTAGQVGVAWGWYTLSPTFGLWSGTGVPAAYGTEKLKKIMVLMTDGEYNSAYCKGVISSNTTSTANNTYNSGSGGTNDMINCMPENDSNQTGAPPDSAKPAGMDSTTWATVKSRTAKNKSIYTQSKKLCAAMKAKGIEIFTIEFQLDTNYPDRVDLVSNCATDASHRVTASDGASLKAAFKKIAASIGDPRIQK